MKMKNMITTIVAILLAVAVMVTMFFTMRHEEPVERRAISVILNKSSDSRWTSFIAGLRDAAMENNVNLNIVTTDVMETLEQEMEIAAREINAGAQGIVIHLSSEEGIEDLVARFSSSVVIEIVDSGDFSGYGENNIGSVFTDDVKVGNALFDLLQEQKDVLRIGVMAENANPSVSTRLATLLGACEENNIRVKWLSPDVEMDFAGFDAIVALENSSLERAADLAFASEEDVYLIGYGNSKKNIYYLDNEIIDAMIVPHEYEMGYLALANMLERLDNPNAMLTSKTVEAMVVQKEMIFTSEMETLLFPITR